MASLAPAVDQRGVDGALVLAGIVNYPPQSPLAAYFLDSWTSIHQFGAILLRAGIDQSRVNAAMFLFPCALFVCGYAMIIYGLTGRFLLALAVGPAVLSGKSAGIIFLPRPIIRRWVCC